MKYMLLITPALMCGSASTASTKRSKAAPGRMENTIRPGSVAVIVGAGGEPGGAPWTLRQGSGPRPTR
jgi:hypothetical protein